MAYKGGGLTMNLRKYTKAFMPLIVMVVLAILAKIGVTPDMSIKEVVTLAATSGLVYWFPNKQS